MGVAITCAFSPTDRRTTIGSDADPNLDRHRHDDFDAKSPPIVACHAHFSGPQEVPRTIVSHVFSSGDTQTFEFEVPTTDGVVDVADALCVTLVQRHRGGWLRHSRARIDLSLLSESETVVVLKNEQLDGTDYGEVTAKWAARPSSRVESVAGTLYREWFFVPNFANALVREAKKKSEWFKDRHPTKKRCEWSGGELSGRVHMPLWNNQSGSIPGVFFAFSCRRDTSRYTNDDLEDVFCVVARPLTGGTTLSVKRRPRLVGEWLATGLMAFGKSIQYQGDRTVDSPKIVERFSSTARLDGLGDCEDIAKETAMAHADLVAAEKSWTRSKKITEATIDMCALVAEAKKYVCAVALCTVRRSSGSTIEAHAFAMLLPKCAFSDYRGDETDRHAFVADGTYPCDPASRNEPAEGVRPWKYEHVVSALVYGEGEIFFRYKSEETGYGVLADDLFPVVKPNVKIEWGFRALEGHREVVEHVLASNLPTTTRTFQHESQSIGTRFRKLVRWGDIDTRRIFTGATPEEKKRIRLASAGFRTSCPTRETFDARLEMTTRHKEEAGNTERPAKEDWKHIVGGYGSVSTVDAAHPYHTHHRPTGFTNHLDFNPPTPDDVAIFIADRAYGFIAPKRRGDVQTTSTVITRKNRYEMSTTDDETDAVTRLWLKCMTDDKLKKLKEDEKWAELRPELVSLAMAMVKKEVVGEWVEYDAAGNPKLLVDITKRESKRKHDAYLEVYRRLGVIVSYASTEDYESEGMCDMGGKRR